MEIVYATTRHPLAEGRKFQNPRFFSGALPGATKVYLTDVQPVIAAAYAAAGVEVVQVGDEPVDAPKPRNTRKPAKRRSKAKATPPVAPDVVQVSEQPSE